MNWSRHRRGTGRSHYHHGNLKEALIDAALDLIREHGPLGFTFAEAARQAGVSPAAPYRHFRDRDDLMADVARRGFEQFEAALTKAWNEGKPEPLAALTTLGRAYLAFAKDEPAYYAAMFEAGAPQNATPELTQAGDRAFAVLKSAAESVAALLPKSRRPPPLMMALHIWALSHGVASLFSRGNRAGHRSPSSAEDLLEAGVLVYLRGAGLGDKA